MFSFVFGQGEPEVLCDLCGKKFHTEDIMKIHRKIHLNEKFECAYCAKTFKLKQYLSNHMKNHVSMDTDNDLNELATFIFSL